MATPLVLWQRLLLLCGCLAAGVVVGAVGFHFTGGQEWFLAVPLAVGAGWMLVADPAACDGPGRKGD